MRNPDELEAIRRTLLPDAVALVKRHDELCSWFMSKTDMASADRIESALKRRELETINRKLLAALTGLTEAEIRDEDAERAVYE